MRIIGNIHSVDITNKLISLKLYKRVVYFYFQTSQMNLFKRYLYSGIYIDLEYDEGKFINKKGIGAYLVNYVNKIFSKSAYKRIFYFDKFSLNTSLSSFLGSLGNVMFLDLEMTMPPYGYHGKDFKAEIIQVGYLLVNNNGDEINRYSNYIKPTIQKTLSKRVIEFLNITQEMFYAKAIDYKDFYEEFKEINDLYHPSIIIYGKNDSITLNNSFKINGLPLIENIRYVNICRLIKSYYNLKNEPGLFKLYQTYYHNQDLQVHDAFNDCYVTKEVFKAFRDDVNLITNNYEMIRRTLEPNK